jgi:hypothetical protein
MVPTPNVVPEPDTGGILPSTAGYAQLTQLAETAVATVNLTLKSGWLQDVELPNETLNGSPINVNTVAPPATVQFTPIGLYSDDRRTTNPRPEHVFRIRNHAGGSSKWVEALLEKNHIKSEGVTAGKLVAF